MAADLMVIEGHVRNHQRREVKQRAPQGVVRVNEQGPECEATLSDPLTQACITMPRLAEAKHELLNQMLLRRKKEPRNVNTEASTEAAMVTEIERIARLETEIEHINAKLDSMSRKVDATYELLLRAKGAQWAILVIAGFVGFFASKISVVLGWLMTGLRL